MQNKHKKQLDGTTYASSATVRKTKEENKSLVAIA